MFDTHKTIMIGLPCVVKKLRQCVSRFDRIPERDGQTHGQTDRQT